MMATQKPLSVKKYFLTFILNFCIIYLSTGRQKKMINIDTEMQAYKEKLESLNTLIDITNELPAKDQNFASSLTQQFIDKQNLSNSQWNWVNKLVAKVKKAEPIYGDFKAIYVMFQIAGENLKYPKIRLLSKENVFVQLNFKKDSQNINVYRDGWKNHGKRKFIARIIDNMIVPESDELTEDIKTVIQELALDPLGVSKVMAGKLGACMYCGRRLSDPTSKHVGFGKTCAKHYGLKWGM